MSKVNYFFLWHYSKIAFVYPLMKTGEVNILILRLNCADEKFTALKFLHELEKITEVIFVNDGVKTFYLSCLYRIFIYPFKSKSSHEVVLYLDGFRGYLPLYIANLGYPDEINMYEEGESIYIQDALLHELPMDKFKNILVRFIKKILFVKRVSMRDMRFVYVRNKERFEGALSVKQEEVKFKVMELDVVKELKSVSGKDKFIFEKIFPNDLKFNKKKHLAIVLSQPLYHHNILSKEHTKKMFDTQLTSLLLDGFDVFLKLHPKEVEDIYMIDSVTRINKDMPFELLALLDVEFDKGITYNSTSINCSLIKQKVYLSNLSPI